WCRGSFVNGQARRLAPMRRSPGSATVGRRQCQAEALTDYPRFEWMQPLERRVDERAILVQESAVVGCGACGRDQLAEPETGALFAGQLPGRTVAGQSAHDEASNPVCRVGRKPSGVSFRIKIARCTDKSEVALLNQVFETCPEFFVFADRA